MAAAAHQQLPRCPRSQVAGCSCSAAVAAGLLSLPFLLSSYPHPTHAASRLAGYHPRRKVPWKSKFLGQCWGEQPSWPCGHLHGQATFLPGLAHVKNSIRWRSGCLKPIQCLLELDLCWTCRTLTTFKQVICSQQISAYLKKPTWSPAPRVIPNLRVHVHAWSLSTPVVLLMASSATLGGLSNGGPQGRCRIMPSGCSRCLLVWAGLYGLESERAVPHRAALRSF